MAISDDLPGIGALGSLGAILGDLALNSGEIILSFVAVLISSPDIWVSIVLYVRRLGEIVGFSTAWLEPVVVVGTILLLMRYVKRLIDRWRNNT